MPASRKRPQQRRPRPPAAHPGADRARPPLVTPKAHAPARHEVERRSAVWLLYLSRLPRWAVAVLFAAVFLAGMLAPGVAGAVALAVIALALALLAFVTWPSVAPSGRLLRVLTIAALVAWAVAKVAR